MLSQAIHFTDDETEATPNGIGAAQWSRAQITAKTRGSSLPELATLYRFVIWVPELNRFQGTPPTPPRFTSDAKYQASVAFIQREDPQGLLNFLTVYILISQSVLGKTSNSRHDLLSPAIPHPQPKGTEPAAALPCSREADPIFSLEVCCLYSDSRFPSVSLTRFPRL